MATAIDRAPLMHWMAERRREEVRRQRSKVLVEEYERACVFALGGTITLAKWFPRNQYANEFVPADISAEEQIRCHTGTNPLLHRPANLFRGNVFASVIVPDFRQFSGFSPGSDSSSFNP